MKPEVQSWYDAYKGKSRPEILELQRMDCSGSHQYKACSILLDEMDEQERNRQEERHGEEMTAAAVANLLARRAIYRAHVGIALGVLAIAVAIGIAVWQQCRG